MRAQKKQNMPGIMQSPALVVKVEMGSLLDPEGNLDQKKTDRLTRLVSGLRNSGIRVAMVSSGAIYLGKKITGVEPATLHIQQALAATGQVQLMGLYQQYFAEYNQMVAQILITADVVNDPVRNFNARNTLTNLLDRGVIPVVNENDSVSTEDIELNDNYYLVLRVASLIDAVALLIHLPHGSRYLLIAGKGKECIYPADENRIPELLNKLSELCSPDRCEFPDVIPQYELF